MSKPRVVVLASEGLSTDLLIESVSFHSDVIGIYLEARESKFDLLKRRFKKLPFFQFIGQLLFLVVAIPFIPTRKKRITEIIQQNGYSAKFEFEAKNITSVHKEGLITELVELNPDLIIVNGTRILKKQFIEKCPCPIVNIHVGITPKYRGIHGGFWALYEKDIENFGVTLHFVDAGIDTGKIIAQKRFKPITTDNYNTYPILQYCEGLSLLESHLTDILEEKLPTIENIPQESHLYYHPTLGEYLFGKAK